MPVAEPAAEASVPARAGRRRAAARDHAAARPVTEPVTVIGPKDPVIVVDPDRVRLTQAADYAQTGVWRVEQQHTDDPDRPCVQLGTLIPTRTGGTGGGKRWTARDQAWLPVSGGPWKTRQDALLHLTHAPPEPRQLLRPPGPVIVRAIRSAGWQGCRRDRSS
jgi:hypothetical protein